MAFPSRRRLLLVLLAVFSSLGLFQFGGTPLRAETPALLQRIFQRESASKMKNLPFELRQEDGPWMILATTFVGENAKQQAMSAAGEIRHSLRLPAYIYREEFDFSKSEHDAQTRTRIRYVNPHHYEAYAVLVGEYDSIEHPNIERDLVNLKTASLSVYRDPNQVGKEISTRSPATTVKAFSHKLFQSRKGRAKGPMANAFVTRNPMLTEDYFSQPKVDSFVRQLNEDIPFSLLKCNGKFTVVVGTFEGLGTIVDGKMEKKLKFEPSATRMGKFAKDADKMVHQLRKDGELAFQFHDRYRSLVTVGSFETLGRELPGGGFEYAPEIRRVMQKYSAFNAQAGARTIPGTRQIAVNHAASIPFDVQPTPIAVPKSSKRSLYGAKFGMR